jgi:hypothetical protein
LPSHHDLDFTVRKIDAMLTSDATKAAQTAIDQ